MAQTAEILEALPPAQMQPTGLAQFDLNVTATPLVITWDKDAVSTLLDTVLAQYAGLEVQEADVPAIKNEMAGLNRLKERMDNARKDIKRRIAGPLDGFDAEVKALIARIVDARAALDTQVKDFERRDREGRRAAVQCVVDNIKSCEGVPELDIPINPSWLNKSTRQAEIHEDIKRIIAAYKRECEETRRMEQAKADRIALVEATAKAQAEQHGFALPLSKFAACLTPDISGEDAAGIETAVHLLRTVGGDESRKMTGKTVVIGGGNVAIDAARVSLRCGSDGVTMVCLEPRDKMPASPEEIAEAEEEGTKITCGYGPKEFLSENGHVTAVVLKKCTGLYNAAGRFAPTYDENDTITLPCDNIVLSIGQCIEWGDLLNGEAVQLGRGQGAVADALTYQTAQPDIFVGGDVCTGPRFAIDAIAAGKQGAISIHRFVQPNTSLTIGRNRRDFHELDKSNLALGEYDRAPRQSAALDAGIDAHRSFRDAHLTLTEDQVKIETARCLGCGASVVDPNKCIGCGVCTTKCEFDAIRLHRDLPECSKMVRSEDKFKAILPYMAKREIKIRFAKKEK